MTRIADEIVYGLFPVIGKGLARSAVNIQCKKIGILPDSLTKENVHVFSEQFRKVMQIFAGERIDDKIAVKIRKI
ncbi:MAG: hypothetical protein WCF90_03480 [Methanomicrobiales archaeon]